MADMKAPHPTGLSAAESAETRAMLEAIADAIAPVIAPHGFLLVTFAPASRASPHGGRTNFISNITRQDSIAAMKELIARWEGQSLKGGHA